MTASALKGLGGLIHAMGLSERISEILDTTKLNKSELAAKAGVSPPAVTQWLTGETKGIKGVTAAAIQASTGYSSAWVSTGKLPKLVKDMPNASPADKRGTVPLISWVAAGQWGAVEDVFHPGEADHWVDAFNSQPGPQAFALRVEGDSMTNPIPGDRSFPSGTIIIVDPGQTASAGDFVIAKDVGTQEATFKRLMYDGGRWFLKPLNPAYPIMEIDDPAIRVIGRVIEFHIGGKL